MADDKRNRPDRQQGDNRASRGGTKERRSGGGSMDSPESNRNRRPSEDELPK